MPPTDIDGQPPAPQREEPDLWRLPDVLDLQIRWRRFDPPKLVTVEGKDEYWPEAIEFDLQLSEPFVSRAAFPVLWVGERALTVTTGRGDRAISFYAREPGGLVPGAPIVLAWTGGRERGREAKVRYQPPKRD
jgi:hypothetical protein